MCSPNLNFGELELDCVAVFVLQVLQWRRTFTGSSVYRSPSAQVRHHDNEETQTAASSLVRQLLLILDDDNGDPVDPLHDDVVKDNGGVSAAHGGQADDPTFTLGTIGCDDASQPKRGVRKEALRRLLLQGRSLGAL